ncbi:MAG TPA: winged helix DNA-binding domain-containing protein [Candidatus Saccharimonadales bacterium]|nr:winged helix DNA-binding domain-containing protein [Candidatus Saccharimonadales bacterium]
MTISELAGARLYNQHLLKDIASPQAVVRSLAAIQSQDFTGGKWAIGLRCKTTEAAVQKLFDNGEILRTHALRPTWHFVAPQDIRWIQALTGPRVHAFNKYYYKKVGLDETLLQKTNKLLTTVLRGGNQLTRTELAKVFTKAGLGEVTGLRFGYILIYAELESLICSGAMQGKQHTYALVEDRAPQAISMPRSKALAELTKRFFTAHGPAQIADFAWWSSLTVADIKQGIELAKLKTTEIEGKTYYYAKDVPSTIPSPIAHLLPNYDEYFIAYKNRTAFSPRFKMSRKPEYADMSYHLLAMDGQMAGGWKREINKNGFILKLTPFIDFTPGQKKALAAAAARLSRFAGLPVKVVS